MYNFNLVNIKSNKYYYYIYLFYNDYTLSVVPRKKYCAMANFVTLIIMFHNEGNN